MSSLLRQALAFVALLSCSACWDRGYPFGACPDPTTVTSKLEDAGDGTLLLTEISTPSRSMSSNRVLALVSELLISDAQACCAYQYPPGTYTRRIKKCAQGQTWNAQDNTCKGEASPIAFCSGDECTAPIESCKGDSTANQQWKMFGFYSPGTIDFASELPKLSPRLPQGESDFFWMSTSATPTGQAYGVRLSAGTPSTWIRIDGFQGAHFVLCATEVEFHSEQP